MHQYNPGDLSQRGCIQLATVLREGKHSESGRFFSPLDGVQVDQGKTLLEVIQPHLPVRLPCYDLAPVTELTFGRSLPKGWAADFGCSQLPWLDGRCVQGPGTDSPRHC